MRIPATQHLCVESEFAPQRLPHLYPSFGVPSEATGLSNAARNVLSVEGPPPINAEDLVARVAFRAQGLYERASPDLVYEIGVYCDNAYGKPWMLLVVQQL